jgi:hypothetical protein
MVFAVGQATGGTLNISGGSLTYKPSSSSSNLSISYGESNYILGDSGETITLQAGAMGVGWSGSGTNSSMKEGHRARRSR